MRGLGNAKPFQVITITINALMSESNYTEDQQILDITASNVTL